jgi:hypothetical protein
MKHSFAPFGPEERYFLSTMTGVDFTGTDFSQSTWLCISGRDDGRLLGVCCFEFKTSFDAHFSAAIADPRCLTRRLLKVMFGTVFSRAARITALIEPTNERAIRQARRLGFTEEGYARCIIEGERDALVMGMLRQDCRFLPRGSSLVRFQEVSDGIQPQTA